jgi:hypothetical protein
MHFCFPLPSTTSPTPDISLSPGSGMKGPCETYVPETQSHLIPTTSKSITLMLICIYAHYQGTVLELLPAIKMHDVLINVHLQEMSSTGTKIYQILYISTFCMKH